MDTRHTSATQTPHSHKIFFESFFFFPKKNNKIIIFIGLSSWPLIWFMFFEVSSLLKNFLAAFLLWFCFLVSWGTLVCGLYGMVSVVLASTPYSTSLQKHTLFFLSFPFPFLRYIHHFFSFSFFFLFDTLTGQEVPKSSTSGSYFAL